MIRRLRRLGSDDRGSSLLELALTLPIMLMLVFGCYELTRLIRADMKLRSATQTFASLVAAGADPTSAEAIADSCRGARLALAPFVSGGFAAAVVSVSKPASGRAAVDWEDLSCGDAARVPDADALALAKKVANDPGDSVIIVAATYLYSSSIDLVLPASFTLSRTAYARPRSGKTLAKQ